MAEGALRASEQCLFPTWPRSVTVSSQSVASVLGSYSKGVAQNKTPATMNSHLCQYRCKLQKITVVLLSPNLTCIMRVME